MSWWIYLQDKNGETFSVDLFTEGGTYTLGGSNEAELNVTYNYGKHFPFKSLNGKLARETIPEFRRVIEKLGTEKDKDYWNSTPGNVGYALSILLKWAEQHPDGIWIVH